MLSDHAPQLSQAITRAYEVLSDKEKRHIYDKYGEEGLEQGSVRSKKSVLRLDLIRIMMSGKDCRCYAR